MSKFGLFTDLVGDIFVLPIFDFVELKLLNKGCIY